MWSIPLAIGLALIIYHQSRIRLAQRAAGVGACRDAARSDTVDRRR